MADRNLLLVEGKDDLHVVSHLAQYYQLPDLFRIKEKGGIDNLLDTLEVELEGSELERLGVIVDADTDLNGRWQALCNILTRAGYAEIPALPSPVGTIVRQEGSPVVGVWIMPDNTLPSGMLEHFIGFLIPAGDALWAQARNCLDRIPQSERRFLPQHDIKAHVHTWLAWQEEPGTPLGSAITKRYLDASAPQGQQLVAWLRRVFDLGA